MTLNFPDSPSTGDIYNDSTSGFQYEWNGTVWISTDPQRAANIKELDDISSGFNGSTTQFNLRVSSSAVEPVSDAQLLISVGGVMQNPTNDYTVSGSTITFTTAPSAGLTFFGTFLGQALSLNTVQDGTVEFASFKTGTAGVGIKSDGTAIGVGITQIDFVGSGNTVVSVGNTVSVYIAAGIDTTGTSKFNNIITTGDVTGNLNVTGIVTATTLHGTLATAAQTNITSVGTLSALTATSLTAATGVTTNATNTQLVVTGVSTYTGAIDANGGANIAGGLVANSAQVSDLTSGRVTYAGGSGELQDSGNLTFSGSELTAASATVSDLTDNRVVIAGSSGALEDSSNLTFDGSTLTVNGDVSVAGTITYQEVSEIDAVGFVTARKGVRVTNGGIIVTAGLSTFSDDVKFDGANADITFDRSADDLIFGDNAQAKFGTGGDLSIFHDGSNSYLLNNTGNLYLQGTANNSITIGKSGGEICIKAVPDSGVELYFDNTKRVNTTSVGLNVVGNVDCDSINNAGISTFTGNATFAGNAYVNGTHLNMNTAYIDFSGNISTPSTGVSIFRPAADTLAFSNNNSESMRIDSSGDVGIGTISVARGPLHLHKSGGDCYFHMTNGTTGTTSSDGFTIHQGGLDTLLNNRESGNMRLYTGNSERLRIDSSGSLMVGCTAVENNAIAQFSSSTGSGALGSHITVENTSTDSVNNTARVRLKTDNGVAEFFAYRAAETYLRSRVGGASDLFLVADGASNLKCMTNGSVALTINSSQNATFAGSVSDSKGDLRDIPKLDKSSAHTIVASDAGKAIQISTGGVTVNASVMTGSEAVTIINGSGSDQTITQGSGMTMYNTADASSGNRVLAGRGMATIYYVGGDQCYISGSGLS